VNPGERGSVSVVLAAGALLFCTFALAIADLGSMLLARARAQAAADAAALAAVVQQAPVLGRGSDPEGAARTVAEENGASLTSCTCTVGTADADVEVTVVPRLAFIPAWRDRVVRARARAELDPDVLSYRDPG
jgi:secretion/DNA translocation related TadE-like protein